MKNKQEEKIKLELIKEIIREAKRVTLRGGGNIRFTQPDRIYVWVKYKKNDGSTGYRKEYVPTGSPHS